MTGRLSGKVVLITGAGAGIGLAATQRFLSEGAKLVLVDLDLSNVREVLAAASSNDVVFAEGDVTSEAFVKSHSFLALETFGKLDVALLNAGMGMRVQSWLETDEALMDKMYAINLKGPWLGIKHAVAAMKASPHGGQNCSIILTSSVASTYGEPGFSPYTAAKWGVRGLGLSAAQEFGPLGIRVNTIQPGATQTKLYEESFPEEVKRVVLNSNVLKRVGQPEEIANVMLFLASDESSFMSGSTIAVHAGQTPT